MNMSQKYPYKAEASIFPNPMMHIEYSPLFQLNL